MLVGAIVLSIVMLGIHLSGTLGHAILPALAIPDRAILTLNATSVAANYSWHF